MGLPDAREYDVVDGGPISATIANGLQDGVVAARRGQRTWHYHPSGYTLDGNATYISSGGYIQSSTATTVTIPLQGLPAGANIDEAKFWLDENSQAAAISCRLIQANTAFTNSNIDSGTSAGDGSANQVTITPDHLHENDSALALTVEIPNASQRVGVVRVKWTPTLQT